MRDSTSEAPHTPPDVSIIVPMFNAAATIAESVQSALASGTSSAAPSVQVEVIISDDGSTDSSRDIAQALAASDPRVQLLHFGNTGQSAARNRGIAVARGRFLRFLDADDRAAPQSTARLVAHPLLMRIRSECLA